MNQTFKHFWAHRRQNAWIITEIALVVILSFYFIDYFTVIAYDTYLSRPATDFEREHLLVGQMGSISTETNTDNHAEESPDTAQANSLERFWQRFWQKEWTNLNSIRDQIRALPEVQSAGFLTRAAYGATYFHVNSYSSENDSTRKCGAYLAEFNLHEQFFETMGLTPLEGSIAAEVLSEECPADGAVITRSMAMALFGTEQVVGRRIVEWDASDRALQKTGEPQVVKRFTIAAVVEDFRLIPYDRYAYVILTPVDWPVGDLSPQLFIRLRPDADATAFVNKINSSKPALFQAGSRILVSVVNYNDYLKRQTSKGRDQNDIASLLSTFIVLLLINVLLGTLGTFWLQLRKRTEDIGIMRSFGAKRKHIFWMVWCEAALLTFIACIIGQVIWLQFAFNVGVCPGLSHSGTGSETDWVSTFWLHYLIICFIQYVVMLIIVTIGVMAPTFIAMYKRPVKALHYE